MSDWFFQDCIEADLSAFLISAIESGEISSDSRDAYDRTPLMVAIEFEKTELVEALLVLGGDASGKSSDGETCLSMLSIEGILSYSNAWLMRVPILRPMIRKAWLWRRQ